MSNPKMLKTCGKLVNNFLTPKKTPSPVGEGWGEVKKNSPLQGGKNSKTKI
jgi:hypothetical protein